MELTRLYPLWMAGGVRSGIFTSVGTHPAEVAAALRSFLHEGYLSDLYGTDYPGQVRRTLLTWVYWAHTRGVRLSFQVGWIPWFPAPLVTGGVTWFEREVWEMFGVLWEGHPDLRRLITDYGFDGTPLIKEFPVGGYKEVRYSERVKRVVTREVSWTQEFRTWDFTSPWHR